MSKYIILTDSTIDMGPEFVKEHDLVVLPLTYEIEGKFYKNSILNPEMDLKEFYEKVKKGAIAITSQINSETFKEEMTKYLKLGYDILGVSFSSALSGSFNSMRLATEELRLEFKDRKILIIDSLCASTGEGLLVYYTDLNRQKGMTIEENYENIMELKNRINHWFTVDDIDVLKRGGRVNAASAFLAKALSIKPVLRVSIDGKLLPFAKKLGRKMALRELVDKTIENIDTTLDQPIYVTNANSFEDSEYVAKKIKEKLPNFEIRYENIGPVIGAHSGPGTISVFFIGKPKY